MVEYQILNLIGGGSSPPHPTRMFWGVSIVGLMRWPVTPEITGSNPVLPALSLSSRG